MSTAAEEAHALVREATLVGEELEWEGAGGELSDEGFEVWAVATEVERLEVGEAGVKKVGGWEADGEVGRGGDGDAGAEVVGHGDEPLADQGDG